jgi:hypothetical protein
MARFRRLLRRAFELLSAFVLVPIIGEFFIQWAKEHGFYEHPLSPMESAMSRLHWVFTVGSDPTYRIITAFICGTAFGMWVDAYLRGKESGIPGRCKGAPETFFSPFGRYKIGWVNVYSPDEQGTLSAHSVKLISEVNKIVKVKAIIPWLYYRIELNNTENNVHVFFRPSWNDVEFKVAAFGDIPFY